MSDYFVELGKATAAALSRHPAERERLRQFSGEALDRHLAGPMARDAALSPVARTVQRRFGSDFDEEGNEMPVRGGQNYADPSDQDGGETIDATEAQQRLQGIFDALDPVERPAMLLALAQFVQEHQGETDAMDGVPNNNLSAMDRGIRSRRKLAQDIAIQRRQGQAFASRWSGLTSHLEIWR